MIYRIGYLEPVIGAWALVYFIALPQAIGGAYGWWGQICGEHAEKMN